MGVQDRALKLYSGVCYLHASLCTSDFLFSLGLKETISRGDHCPE